MTSLGVEQLSTAAAGTGAGKYRVYGGGRASHVDTGEREGASTGGADGFASLASIGDSGSGARDAGDRDGKARRKHHKKHRRHHKHGSAEHSGAGSGGDASDEAGGGGEAGGAARRSRRHRHHRDKSDTGGGVSSPSARHRPPPSPASANPALSLNLKVVHDAKRGADKSYDEARLALSGLSPHALEELADLKPTKGFEYQVGMAVRVRNEWMLCGRCPPVVPVVLRCLSAVLRRGRAHALSSRPPILCSCASWSAPQGSGRRCILY